MQPGFIPLNHGHRVVLAAIVDDDVPAGWGSLAAAPSGWSPPGSGRRFVGVTMLMAGQAVPSGRVKGGSAGVLSVQGQPLRRPGPAANRLVLAVVFVISS